MRVLRTAWDIGELLARLATDERRGLSEAVARSRLAHYGPNELAAEKRAPPWRRFLSQFQDVLVILLLVATGVSAALWSFERDAALRYEAIAIFAVVLLNALDANREDGSHNRRELRTPQTPCRRKEAAPLSTPGFRAPEHKLRIVDAQWSCRF
jgi:hypothetical protein